MSKQLHQVAVVLTALLVLPSVSYSQPQEALMDQKLINWIKSNINPETKLFYSFDIPEHYKASVYVRMGEQNSVPGIIERVIVEEGLIIYDGAVAQILLSMLGEDEDLEQASAPLEIYWEGRLGELNSIRAGYPHNSFIYDVNNPSAVSSNLDDKGQRGFIFRIINANGRYNASDPLDGKEKFSQFPTQPRIHWEDWKPVAGENAWVVMAAMHIYHQKYYDPHLEEYRHNINAVELKLAEELARAALLLQVDNGGIRMAPLGTYRNPEDFKDKNQPQGTWWHRQISSENNISWYAAFRMLYKVTGDVKYKEAMKGIESYFRLVWNSQDNYFYQGMSFEDGQWHPNSDHFALDVQTWAIACFGPDKIDSWFGEGASYRIWQTAKQYSGVFDEYNLLRGVGFTRENDRVSVEWTAGAILAAQIISESYDRTQPFWWFETSSDAETMREGIEKLRTDLSYDQAAYSYSSKRDWIPFGWYSHEPEVLSLASTGWVVLVDAGFNPFYLSGRKFIKNHVEISGIVE